MRKNIISFITIIILVIITFLYVLLDSKKNNYIELNSNEISELWIQYEQFLSEFADNVNAVSKIEFDDENINQITQVLIRNYYEYNRSDSQFDNSFYELKTTKSITIDNLYYMYFDYNKYNFKGYAEMFSIKSTGKYRTLYNYLNTLNMFTKNLSDSIHESNFKRILSEKIIEIQLMNSMTEWLIYSET